MHGQNHIKYTGLFLPSDIMLKTARQPCNTKLITKYVMLANKMHFFQLLF